MYSILLDLIKKKLLKNRDRKNKFCIFSKKKKKETAIIRNNFCAEGVYFNPIFLLEVKVAYDWKMLFSQKVNKTFSNFCFSNFKTISRCKSWWKQTIFDT